MNIYLLSHIALFSGQALLLIYMKLTRNFHPVLPLRGGDMGIG
jgi:hypothetical protein